MAEIIRLTKAARENESREFVVATTPGQLQLVLVTLQPLESIPMETHGDGTQMTRVEAGVARVTVDGETLTLAAGEAIWIPSGVEHLIVNASDREKLQLSTVYSPPQH